MECIIQKSIEALAINQNELILDCFKKQDLFVTVEDSRSLIDFKWVFENEYKVFTDYFFNGKLILRVYPPTFRDENGVFVCKINYQEYD